MPVKASKESGLAFKPHTTAVGALKTTQQIYQPEDSSSKANQVMADSQDTFLLYAKPVLTLLTQVKQCASMPNMQKLHQQLVEEVNRYIERLEQDNCSPFLIDCAAYCLCAAVDEAVLGTEWGTQSLWVQQSLLSMFRSETLGGERFYLIANRLIEEPRKHLGVIELIYVLLSLGFEGQYYGAQAIKRDAIKQQLYMVISKERGKIIKQLSPQWQDTQTIDLRKKKRQMMWRMAIGGLACVVMLYVWYSFALYKINHPIIKRLDAIGHESPITAYSQLINRELFVHSDVGGQHVP
jgi:type VI secretion system protein ImpK